MTKQRVLSWLWDYLVILAWLVVVFLFIGIPTLAGWLDLGFIWSRRVPTDIAITVLTVVPLWTYLVSTEASIRAG